MANDAPADDFSKYEYLRDTGTSAQDIYRHARADNLSRTTCIRMLRMIFGVSLIDAKEIMVIGDGLADSLDDYQAKLVPGLMKAFESDQDENQISE